MRTWGLPFPFLITHILRKKGIKGNAIDGPITKSPYFGHIQWNQSCSHMPRAVREPEMMDVDEPVVPKPTAPEIAHPSQQSRQWRHKKKKKKSMKKRSHSEPLDFVAFQDILEDMQSHITNL
jgi:hypothetical protein